MKNFLFSVFLLFIVSNIKSQPWQNVTPIGYSDAFFSSGSFINENEGWIFARQNWPGSFDLLHTNDGAQNFEKLLTLSGSMECWKIQMLDSLYGYAKIEDGAFHKNYFWQTTDGGYNWQDITDTTLFNMGKPLHSSHTFYFIDRTTGFFGGNNSIYKTLDAGLSWQQMNTPQIIDSASSNLYRPNSIYFVDNQYGWAASSLVMDAGFGMKTVDGGESWAVCTPISGDLYDIDFSDSLTGGMVGSGTWGSTIFLTQDNYNTVPNYLYPWNQYASTISYQNDSILWISGSPPSIFRSKDAGTTFEMQDSTYLITNPNDIIMDIQFHSNTAYAIGNVFLLKFEDDLNTSIHESDFAEDVVVISPNPASDKIKVTLSLAKSGLSTLEIYSLSGERVENIEKYMQQGKNEILIDIKSLSPGVYILKTNTASGKVTKKLLKF
jgi:photosystem II stability/assembly factor-like uncharacterized protein